MMVGLYVWLHGKEKRIDIFENGMRTTGGLRYNFAIVSYAVNSHFCVGYRSTQAIPSEFETAVMITPKEYL